MKKPIEIQGKAFCHDCNAPVDGTFTVCRVFRDTFQAAGELVERVNWHHLQFGPQNRQSTAPQHLSFSIRVRDNFVGTVRAASQLLIIPFEITDPLFKSQILAEVDRPRIVREK
ncbi:hypothetical protein HY214_03065 [Candidatus Roizmanbacteria bacterium]|nr:hypothetical protein [Candidatus Roizmanbacteria bacterium]